MPDRHVDHLLVGGGLASANCARWLRESGGEGSILLVGRELDPPYNRPPCSKGFLQGKESREDTFFRPSEWWGEQDVELLTRTSVLSLDLGARTAKLSTKEDVSFGQLLVATGANVRRLSVEGDDLDQIHYLRTLGNSVTIREGTDDAEDVVLIGGSYIGCEVAASLTLRGKRCTIVMQEDVTFERTFGKQAGRFLQDALESHGVTVHGNDALARFEGADGRVAKVVTQNGLELPAQAVVIGAGAVPDVRLAQSAGLEIGPLGGVRANTRLQTAVEGVYTAGDICEYDSVVHARPMRIEHWDVAFNQGKTVALNMLGNDVPHDVVPYFFSDLADWASLEYVGPANEGWDREVVRGSLADGAFSLWYLKDDRVVAALSIGRSDDLEHARTLIAEGTNVSRHLDRLADVDSDLASVGDVES